MLNEKEGLPVWLECLTIYQIEQGRFKHWIQRTKFSKMYQLPESLGWTKRIACVWKAFICKFFLARSCNLWSGFIYC